MPLCAEIMSGALGKRCLKQMLVWCCLEIAAGRCCLTTCQKSICSCVLLSKSCGAGGGPGPCRGGKVKGWTGKGWGVLRTPGNAGVELPLVQKENQQDSTGQDLSFVMGGQVVGRGLSCLQSSVPLGDPPA